MREPPKFRPSALLVAALALAAPGCGGGDAARAGLVGPRNVLLVLLDTTRSDHLGCYGYPRETTPTIDGLAADGVRFDSVFAQSSLTPVSAGSLFSGAHPFRHGVRSLFVVDGDELAGDVGNLFELLAASGRRTAGFVSAKPMGRQYGLARGFETYEDDMASTKAQYGIGRFGDAPQRPGDVTADLALTWLEQHGREPFALLLHMFDAHDPSFVPPAEFLAEQLSFPVPDPLDRYLSGAAIRELFGTPQRLVELYDAELRFMDHQVARVLEALDALGVREQTLVVVVADHGEAFGEHQFYTHGLLYREHLQVPLIFHGPGLEGGRTVEARVRLVDVFPTLAEMMGLGSPGAEVDGASLVELLEDGAGRGHGARDVYAEVHHAPGDSRGRESEMYSLTSGRWKYVHRPVSGEHELFDLEADPGELTNLYAPDHPEAVRLRVRIEAMGAIDGVAPSFEGLSPEALEELRLLGYL